MNYLTYGATQANWLININVADVIFLSQFNYKSQDLFGPFSVTRTLFYDKSIIYPQQRYFYRIQFKPTDAIKTIEETDLYLNGIQSKRADSYFKLINLIQQNKHLHCICLTNEEGQAISDTFNQAGFDYTVNLQKRDIDKDLIPVNGKYIWDKNKQKIRNSICHIVNTAVN